MSRDLVNHKKWSWYIIDARNEKSDEISKHVNFESTDIYVRDFTVILMFKGITEMYMDNSCWMALL